MKLEKLNSFNLITDEVKTLTHFYDKYGVPYSISEDGVLTTYAEVLPEEIDEMSFAIYADVGHIIQEAFEDYMPIFAKYCGEGGQLTRESIVMMVADIYNSVSCSQSKLLRGLDNQSDSQISELTKKLSEKEKELSEKSNLVDNLIKENDKLTKALVEAVASSKPTFFNPPSFNPTCSTDDSNPSVSTQKTSKKFQFKFIDISTLGVPMEDFDE